MLYSPALDRAVRFAATAHEGQRRKDRTQPTPLIAHPVMVALLVQGCGLPERAVIAALLHDVVEDTETPLEAIRAAFGEEVAALVDALTEPPKPTPWEARKEAYLASLGCLDHPPEAAAVSLADKLHNMRTLTESLARAAAEGRAAESVLSVFSRGPALSLGFYRGVLAAAEGRGDLPVEAAPLLQGYREALAALEAALGEVG